MSKKRNKRMEITFTPLGRGFFRCNLCSVGKAGKMKKTKLEGHRNNCPNLRKKK